MLWYQTHGHSCFLLPSFFPSFHIHTYTESFQYCKTGIIIRHTCLTLTMTHGKTGRELSFACQVMRTQGMLKHLAPAANFQRLIKAHQPFLQSKSGYTTTSCSLLTRYAAFISWMPTLALSSRFTLEYLKQTFAHRG